MAITIQHAPNLQLLAQSGYVAGAGFYRQQQREMALRERMQQRALDYNMMSQEIAHRNAMQRQLMAGQQNAVAQGIQNRAGLQRAMALQNDQQDFPAANGSVGSSGSHRPIPTPDEVTA